MIFSDFQSFLKPSTKSWKSTDASNAPDLTFGNYLHSLRRVPLLPLASLAQPLHPHISSIRPPPIWTPRTPLAGIPALPLLPFQRDLPSHETCQLSITKTLAENWTSWFFLQKSSAPAEFQTQDHLRPKRVFWPIHQGYQQLLLADFSNYLNSIKSTIGNVIMRQRSNLRHVRRMSHDFFDMSRPQRLQKSTSNPPFSQPVKRSCYC